MYTYSKSCVKIDNCLTYLFSVQLGVKQGDNLIPNLFKIFINDLPDYLDSITLNGRSIHCLMYADDIILLSSSANGLQEKIDILSKYCKDWCLNVNTLKTKIMIFNNAGKFHNIDFNLNGVRLECVSRYKYVGVCFCLSGSFTYTQEDLYNKSLKAYFKFSKEFLSLKPNIHISMHVFDHTIKSILLYGCEIWGSFNPFTSKFRKGLDLVDLEQIYSELHSEKNASNILQIHTWSS